MQPSPGILLLTQESETEQAVVSAVGANERLQTAEVCRGLEDLASQLDCRPTAAALVDIDPQPVEMLQQLDTLVTRYSSTRFVVLAARATGDLVLEAMQAGARHVMAKGSIHSDLVSVLQRLMPGGSRAPALAGSLITVLSASGGCGATTVAVNLAHEMALEKAKETLLVDLDPAYGAVATYLSLKGQYGVADVLASSERVDSEFIRSTAVAYSDKLSALINPLKLNRKAMPSMESLALEQVLAACTHGYTCTVADAARVPGDIAATLAHKSKRSVLVTQLNVKDLCVTREFCSMLLERGVQPERLLVAVNRYSKRGSLVTLDDLRKVIPADVEIETLASDFRSCEKSLNYGQPLEKTAPRSPLLRDMRRLALTLSSPPVPARTH